MPQITLPFFTPGQLNYRGSAAGLLAQFNQLTVEQRNSIQNITLALPGNQVQEEAVCCKVTTMVLGGILIFPLCIMCCNCYKASTEPLFSMAISDYEGVAQVIR